MEYIRSKKMEKFFHCTGRIPYVNIIEYLQAADLYVSSSYSDGTSVALLDAMASRLAVVLTDVPSNLEWIHPGENGEVVSRGDSPALAQRILELAGSPERTAQYGERNLDIVGRCGDWKKNFNSIETIYHQLVH
jgi:glycosyltransferase involved in cell wall biosynthesis